MADDPNAGGASPDDLVVRARGGDGQALDSLLRLHLPGLRAFVRLQCGPALRSHESSSDLVQTVCREVLAHIERCEEGGNEGFRRWLYTTAMRKIRNRAAFWQAERRDAGRVVGGEAGDRALEDAYRSITTPSAQAIGHEFVESVERAFDVLTDDEREVILLARVLGASHQDIAKQTGRNEGACRVLLHRALGKLAKLLDEE